LTYNVKLFRFTIPNDGSLDLPVGRHVSAMFVDKEGQTIMRFVFKKKKKKKKVSTNLKNN